jgi:molecular chaperone HtpG
MERILQNNPQAEYVPTATRVLELNADHPVLEKLVAAHEAGDGDRLGLYANLLYDQALLVAGLPIEDPIAFAKNVCELM